jgi:hypothetical protein
MSMKNINSALTQAYIDLGLGLTTAYEGVQFDPAGVTDWAAVNVIPAINAIASLGVGGEDEEEGIFQLTFHVEQGKGTSKLLDWADTVQSNFIAGQGYTYGDTTVLIRSVERTGIQTNDGWETIILSVNWFARFTRPEF